MLMVVTLSQCHVVTLSQGVYRCDNEFIKENSDIREFSEFRDIMERWAGGEYAPRGSASILNYRLPPSAGWAHKHTKTRTKGMCAYVCDVRYVWGRSARCVR